MNYVKTKIVCTIGPATRNLDILKQLLTSGMKVARFNFSHGNHEYHKESIDMLREASRQTGIPVALLLDTKGPEIRTGQIKDNKTINLVQGKTIILTTDEVEGSDSLLSISYKKLPSEISPGKHILIADGLVDLEVEKVIDNNIHCIIRNGSEIGSKKNVNIIGVKTSLPAVTEQDVKDIIFGIEHSFDFIAASFIRKPTDIMEIRGIIDICDDKIDIIAKIEDEEGLENIDEIIRVSDGIMVARGDLGVQLNPELIPMAQKRIIQKCNQANKAVITATQMLDSMINNPKPTRAEVADVANAIFDGTDAIMLSGETANGKYPIQAVEMMQKIAAEVENSDEYQKRQTAYFRRNDTLNMADTISRAANMTARDINANAILTPTLSGNTPKMLSKYRPSQCIIAATPYQKVLRKLLLYWGIYPIICEKVQDDEVMLKNAVNEGIACNYIKNFDKVVIVAGIPLNSPIMLNTIRLHLVADIIGKSLRGYGNIVSGKIVKVNNYEEACDKIKGDNTEILLARYIDSRYKPILQKVKGYILQDFSSISWKEIEAVNPELTALAGAAEIMDILNDGQIVTINGREKLIYNGEPEKK